MGDAPAQRQIRAPAPAGGIGNLRDIMQVVDQAEAEVAPRPGTLDVAVIHRRVGRAKIPFILLVDGCLEDPTFAEARGRLGIVVDAHGGEPVYVGPADAGTALRTQIAQLEVTIKIDDSFTGPVCDYSVGFLKFRREGKIEAAVQQTETPG